MNTRERCLNVHFKSIWQSEYSKNPETFQARSNGTTKLMIHRSNIFEADWNIISKRFVHRIYDRISFWKPHQSRISFHKRDANIILIQLHVRSEYVGFRLTYSKNVWRIVFEGVFASRSIFELLKVNRIWNIRIVFSVLLSFNADSSMFNINELCNILSYFKLCSNRSYLSKKKSPHPKN